MVFESFEFLKCIPFFDFGIAYLQQASAGLVGNCANSTFKPANTEITNVKLLMDQFYL